MQLQTVYTGLLNPPPPPPLPGAQSEGGEGWASLWCNKGHFFIIVIKNFVNWNIFLIPLNENNKWKIFISLDTLKIWCLVSLEVSESGDKFMFLLSLITNHWLYAGAWCRPLMLDASRNAISRAAPGGGGELARRISRWKDAADWRPFANRQEF